jgi:hypothetical protein
MIAGIPDVTLNTDDQGDPPFYCAIRIAIENIGTGPALNVRGTLHGPRGSGPVPYPVEGIAPGHVAVVSFESFDTDFTWTGNDTSISGNLVYEDVAGTTYRTELEFDVGGNAFRAKVAVGPDAVATTD